MRVVTFLSRKGTSASCAIFNGSFNRQPLAACATRAIISSVYSRAWSPESRGTRVDRRSLFFSVTPVVRNRNCIARNCTARARLHTSWVRPCRSAFSRTRASLVINERNAVILINPLLTRRNAIRCIAVVRRIDDGIAPEDAGLRHAMSSAPARGDVKKLENFCEFMKFRCCSATHLCIRRKISRRAEETKSRGLWLRLGTRFP